MNNFDNFEEDEVRLPPKNTVIELRRDLRKLIKDDPDVLDDIKIYKDVTGLNVDKLNKIQLEELIAFCINNKITRERKLKGNNTNERK